MFKNYKCSRCGFQKYYISIPALSDIRNIIADNCPKCDFGNMIIDIDDDTNFTDDFAEKYYNTILTAFSKGDFDGFI